MVNRWAGGSLTQRPKFPSLSPGQGNFVNETAIPHTILLFCSYLPEKVLAGMQWAKDLPINWFYTSIDDDIVVNLAKLAKYIDRLIIERINSSNGRINFPKIPIVCIYSYQNLDLPNRETDSKWYMPTKDFPGRYWPTYCRGGAYTTTSYMAKRLFEVSRRTSRLYLDDVWITGFMRLKVERTNDNIVVGKF